MTVKKNLASFYNFGYLLEIRIESGDFLKLGFLGDLATKNAKKLLISRQLETKSPLLPSCSVPHPIRDATVLRAASSCFALLSCCSSHGSFSFSNLPLLSLSRAVLLQL